jgi:hypothetical protein
MIIGASNTYIDHGYSPRSHPLVLDTPHADDNPRLPDADSSYRLRSHPLRYGELVAHMSDYPTVHVTTCFDPEQGKAKEDIVEQPNVARLIPSPPHQPTGVLADAVALLSAGDCVEPSPYRVALSNVQALQLQAAMQ